jgi:hypothetical protein
MMSKKERADGAMPYTELIHAALHRGVLFCSLFITVYKEELQYDYFPS